MINPTEYYLKLTTSQYRASPRFMAMLAVLLKAGQDADVVADNIINAFNIDTAATSQLDIIGAIVGAERYRYR